MHISIPAQYYNLLKYTNRILYVQFYQNIRICTFKNNDFFYIFLDKINNKNNIYIKKFEIFNLLWILEFLFFFFSFLSQNKVKIMSSCLTKNSLFQMKFYLYINTCKFKITNMYNPLGNISFCVVRVVGTWNSTGCA